MDVNIGHLHPDHDEGDTASDSTCLFRQFEDSDDEEDDFASDFPDELSYDGTIETDVPEAGISHTTDEASAVEDSAVKHSDGTESTESNVVPSIVTEGDETRNVRPKRSHPSSPRSKDVSVMTDSDCSIRVALLPETTAVPGPKKMQVVVGDVAYATYKAVLYYVRRSLSQILNFHLPFVTDIHRCYRFCSTVVVLYGCRIFEEGDSDNSYSNSIRQPVELT